MTTAIPPDLPVSPGGESGVNTVEDEKDVIESIGNKEASIIEKDGKSEKASTGGKSVELEKREKVVGDESEESWLHVPQGKTGRSQPSTPKQMVAEIKISSSKFTVLRTNEEEEGEIVEVNKDLG
ncbi:hypothetical protein DY000_02050307 [Brassica cretica]|uniref:Remorin N-terminal domain-containing protein n=1 Tax=Brassica cretica TaxID=69181 RepID=A0ABQ7F3D1_BRACR|nr:hypothetical protein DY000_02050307 [Brassica cretica]